VAEIVEVVVVEVSKNEKEFNTMLKTIDKLIKEANRAMGKKLTTKDRKKMKKSTFCGPNRSLKL